MPFDSNVREAQETARSTGQVFRAERRDVEVAAYYLFLFRTVKGIPGTLEGDWLQEEERLPRLMLMLSTLES